MTPGSDAFERAEVLRVLLVEGDETARCDVCEILAADGIQVRGLASAREALAQVAGFRPHLVLAAYPPAEDDIDLVAGLRKLNALATVPLVLLAGEGDDLQRYATIAAGADDFLVKPVAPPLLVAAIRARIRRAQRARRANAFPVEGERRGGQLRRGDFLAQLGGALQSAANSWQVLMALRVDQGQQLSQTLGHATSFQTEQDIAARFAPALRDDDAYTLWMEFGFGVLAKRDSREELENLAQDLCRRVVQAPFETRGQELKLSLSVGVALPPGGADTGDPDRWFASAYAAQAIAHRQGGNRYDGVLSRDYGSMPPERVLIIREWAKEALDGENVLIEFQPVLPLHTELAGLYSLSAKLRDFRAPLAGVRRKDYLRLAREAGSLPMIERVSMFSAFEAIEQERARGRATRILLPMDLATIDEVQLLWLDAELHRRKAHADGLIIEFDADAVLAQPDLAKLVQRLEDQGVVIAVSDESGGLDRILPLQHFPAGLLRLPVTAIDSLPPAQFIELLGPWRASGRGIIADGVENAEVVRRMCELQVGYVQGDALAASGPRLDYEFTETGV